MKSRLAMVLASVLLVACVTAALAQQPPAAPAPPPGDGTGRVARPGGMMGGGFGGFSAVDLLLPTPQPQEMDRISQQLNLSAAQKQAIQALAEQKRALTKPLIEQQAPLAGQIQEEMMKSAPNGGAVKAKVGQLHTLRAQVAQHGVDFWVAVRGQLDATQNEQLTNILRRRFMGGGRMRNPGDANPPRDGNRPNWQPRNPGAPAPPDAPPPVPEPEPGQ